MDFRDEQFFIDSEQGTLPHDSWLNSGFLADESKSGHPPSSLCVGENYALLHFAETVFDLEPLTQRDARASNMLDCLDFEQSPLPPLTLEPSNCSS